MTLANGATYFYRIVVLSLLYQGAHAAMDPTSVGAFEHGIIQFDLFAGTVLAFLALVGSHMPKK